MCQAEPCRCSQPSQKLRRCPPSWGSSQEVPSGSPGRPERKEMAQGGGSHPSSDGKVGSEEEEPDPPRGPVPQRIPGPPSLPVPLPRPQGVTTGPLTGRAPHCMRITPKLIKRALSSPWAGLLVTPLFPSPHSHHLEFISILSLSLSLYLLEYTPNPASPTHLEVTAQTPPPGSLP